LCARELEGAEAGFFINRFQVTNACVIFEMFYKALSLTAVATVKKKKNLYFIYLPKVAVELLAGLLRIPEVHGLILGSEVGYHCLNFPLFFSDPSANTGVVLQNKSRPLPFTSFPFTIHSYSLVQCNVTDAVKMSVNKQGNNKYNHSPI
jgi:hypothetical protein